MENAVPDRAAERVANRPLPTTPSISLPFALALQRLLRPNRLWYALAVWLEATPWAYRAFTWWEKTVKGRPLRLPDVRAVCAAEHGLRLPDELSEGTAQRSLRRRRAPTATARSIPGCAACGWSPTSGRPAPAAPPTCGGCSGRSTSVSGAGAPGSTTGSTAMRTCGAPTPRSPPRRRSSDVIPSPSTPLRTTRSRDTLSALGSRLRDALRERRFAVTAELSPPRGADRGSDPPRSARLARLGRRRERDR